MLLGEWFDAGYDLRAWCYACARGEIVEPGIWARYAAIEVADARRRFRCRQCRSRDHVLLVPARYRGPQATTQDVIAAFFFSHHKARKRRR